MTLREKVLWAKFWCAVGVGFFTPWGAGLAQWAATGSLPPLIVWIVIIAAGMVGGASQASSYLSSSFGNYQREKQEQETQMLMRSQLQGGTGVYKPTPPKV